ncbi:23S rRNA (guanosine(2251)-2'-O)-methyltransferase RlmB [Curtobacterium herbarum]|uniref:23S rRNA (Guanosine(2251)-2'-O)-methyltransferase RlmB n=1 Tax=Curtobacterium herbarum TaxID=150122 RepID=A0ABN1ZD67_9MICO|nr:23S rRNA (guanosine(2251)-2'-O)-methyltransferase RlmB [Curtobacterium herbarum]MBM7474225.1 23S rRNA (guanosine2251-2'-O)-methyltransferase [Curtobacterium herbarum]MCS6546047.1 23S rRNA (guanosine(2251)-2'-O)-methyltransferase RlmB [Curtobacterium herbarum]
MKNVSGSKKGRPGAVRAGRKGNKQVGSGGQGAQALEGRKPTPKAEDRPYHPAGKRKAAKERFEAARTRRGGSSASAPQTRTGGRPPARKTDDSELVTGRNSVLEALRTKTPSTTLYVAARIEVDDRVKEILTLANHRGVPIMEIMRPELDRITGHDSVHQGVALKVPAYEYAVSEDLVERAFSRDQVPLLVALDGITDPRNLGAIIRSTAAFGGHGVIVPQRRSVGVTASAWKTSAGAAARTPVAMAPNLTQTLKSLKSMGLFVLGLDGDGHVELDALALADRPIVIVVGSEGKGLSRLVTETCDAIVSIPISSATESLNAGIAASVTLWEVARRRRSA